jgi:hypothetical protein
VQPADDVQTLVIPGVGHRLAEQAPDQLVAALNEFLAPVPRRGTHTSDTCDRIADRFTATDHVGGRPDVSASSPSPRSGNPRRTRGPVLEHTRPTVRLDECPAWAVRIGVALQGGEPGVFARLEIGEHIDRHGCAALGAPEQGLAGEVAKKVSHRDHLEGAAVTTGELEHRHTQSLP